jgi:hypothetical protein
MVEAVQCLVLGSGQWAVGSGQWAVGTAVEVIYLFIYLFMYRTQHNPNFTLYVVQGKEEWASEGCKYVFMYEIYLIWQTTYGFSLKLCSNIIHHGEEASTSLVRKANQLQKKKRRARSTATGCQPDSHSGQQLT